MVFGFGPDDIRRRIRSDLGEHQHRLLNLAARYHDAMIAADLDEAEQRLDTMTEEIMNHRNRITHRNPINATKAREIALAVIRRLIGEV